MAFKITRQSNLALQDPEALLRDLRNKKIQGLLAHQADVIREYCNNSLKELDVAIQLPTGSGKTLVGVLIAEWRRRKFGEKVVYLCPTKQLVFQVEEQSVNKYGIHVKSFVGPRKDYNPEATSQYFTGESIAVTSYSSLFNVNPFFSNPDLIILDDAHSAESYIADAWSLLIDAKRNKTLFEAFCGILKPIISVTDYKRMVYNTESKWDKTWVEKIPTPAIYTLLEDISSILDEHTENTELNYSWRLLRSHLDACNIFISAMQILIRPLIPPTATHLPFSQAKQRLYMSATLGECGELERLTGRRSIVRLKVPKGWDTQGIGRRCFFFPDRSLQREHVGKLLIEFIKTVPRTLFLVPDDKTSSSLILTIRTVLEGYEVFTAKEIEQSKDRFVNSKNAIAIAANRYDGIDFPEDECRLLIVEGLPRGNNLQECFFITRIGASVLLNDRILTRIVQAFGRCTRSATDYSAVVVSGGEIHRFLLDNKRRRSLHPELQAELEFGISQSKELTAQDFIENMKIFQLHEIDWQSADEEILSIRESCKQDTLPCTNDLKCAVVGELEYQYAMWNHDYIEALSACKKVIAFLNDPELMGYRVLWNYFAGCAAYLATENDQADLESVSKQYFNNALKGSKGISWLANLARSTTMDESCKQDGQLIELVERLEDKLEKLGTFHDKRFDKEEKAIIELINSKESKKFEKGHELLGALIGYKSGNMESQGSPDPWWIANDDLCFIFEDHNEAKQDSQLNIKKARQAATHCSWVRENLPLSKNAEVYTVLITPVTEIDKEVMTHLHDVYVWNLNEFTSWSLTALSCIREIRKTFVESGNLIWRVDAASKLIAANISPRELKKYILERSANKVLKIKS